MSKKVLVLSGSPRKGGNSDLLCDAFIKGARESGNEVEKVFIRSRKIAYSMHAIIAKTAAENVQSMMI